MHSHYTLSIAHYTLKNSAPATRRPGTTPTYDENVWAKFTDANSDDLSSSIHILKGVHKRAVDLLKTLNEKDYQREYFHPEYNKKFNLFWLLNLYAWHGKHHTEQIKAALEHKF